MKRNYRKSRKILALFLVLVLAITSLNLTWVTEKAKAAENTDTVKIFFVDNTSSKWISNDQAIVEVVDNTNYHVHYTMTKQGENTWYAVLPGSAYNVTFNRLDAEGTTQWNSWSAGGRDSNNTYYADGAEYGHWGYTADSDEYFHKGDSVYLDVTEYTDWEKSSAVMYVNCTNATKSENDGNNVTISEADPVNYKPVVVGEKAAEHVYKYTFTEDTEGAEVLRFWRGNGTTLWNYSNTLKYTEFKNGKNCIKVTGWNDSGSLDTYTVKTDIDIDDYTDSDSDGIIDWAETLVGLDKESADTDGDGLSDYDEVMIFALNPLEADSDHNGMMDADEDTDSDRLTNGEESAFGTNGMKSDTDGDRLSDYEEVKKYGTDPLMADTDGDGVSDGAEVELGFDPLTAEKSFNVHKSSEETDSVKVSVDVELSGKQVESLSVDKNKNAKLFPKEIPGYLGSAYDFSVDGTFEEAAIHFEFDESLIGSADFDPVIYYFNEAECSLEALDTVVNGNVASATVEHFSTYILINRKVNQDAHEWTDTWSDKNYTDVEIVLVIDDSGSMRETDEENQRLSVAKDLVENLPEGSKVGVVNFSTFTRILTSSLTSDKAEAEKYLTTTYFKSSGSTYMYEAIYKSFLLFRSKKDTTLRMMVVLSDGETWDSDLHSSIVAMAENKAVKICTVGLGSSSLYFTKYLKPLANSTGGEFYLASDASGLADIYNDISKRIDIVTDSDEDGLSDYYEEHMVLFNGVSLVLDKNNPDSDGDGLLDGEEIVLKYEYNEDKTKVLVTGKVKSFPNEKDSDGDGLLDNAVIYSTDGSEVIAPVDPYPVDYNGETNMWKTYITSVGSDTVSTAYGTDEGLKLLEALPDDVCDNIVKLIVKLDGPLTNKEFETIVKTVASLIRTCYIIGDINCGILAETLSIEELDELIGAYILNFIKDADGVAYHSQPDTWQRKFGYNNFYDDVFEVGSKMDTTHAIDFTVGSTTYALWMWKGDYYNLHSGGEVGLYTYKGTDSSGMGLYDAINFEVDMNLSLFHYNSDSDIQNAFHWFPNEPQWWITGFNTSSQFENPWDQHMVLVGKIELPDSMLDSLKASISKSTYKNNFIFDKSRNSVWVMW